MTAGMSRGTVAGAAIASLALLLVIASTYDGNNRDTALFQQGVITIPPSGYVVKQGKAIHAMLDIAAPIDSSSSASIPGIVIPKPGSVAEAADPRELATAHLQALAAANPYDATAGAMQAAAQGGAAASEVRGARQQQLEEEDEEPSMEDGDEDMFPETESESYAEQEPEGDIVPHKVVYNYNYAAPQYGPSPPEQAAQTAPSSPLAKDPMQQPGSLVKPVPNFFVSPFQRWHDEDAAQHAYNLQQWRVKILQAKVRQAELHKRLQALNEKKEAREEHKSGLAQLSSSSSSSSGGGRGREEGRGRGVEKLKSETGKELKDIERQMLALAKVTEKAIAQRSNEHSGGGGGGGGWHSEKREERRSKFMKETKSEIDSLKDRVASLQKRLKSRGPAALQDALKPSSLPSGVPSQVALWQRINSDVKA